MLYHPAHSGAVARALLPSIAMVNIAGLPWALLIALSTTLGSVVQASPSSLATPYIEFRSELIQDGGLRYVQNSGVCETTPGVTQLSGYIDVGKNQSLVRLQ